MATNGYAILDLKEYGFGVFMGGQDPVELENPEKFIKKVKELIKLGKPLLLENILIDDVSVRSVYGSMALYGDIDSEDFNVYIHFYSYGYDGKIIVSSNAVRYKFFELY